MPQPGTETPQPKEPRRGNILIPLIIDERRLLLFNENEQYVHYRIEDFSERSKIYVVHALQGTGRGVCPPDARARHHLGLALCPDAVVGQPRVAWQVAGASADDRRPGPASPRG